jgi:transposase-like protein
VIYSIISIDLKGKKELCGFYTFFGSESKEDWLVIFNNLISRGLKRLALVISDDFSGLKEAISKGKASTLLYSYATQYYTILT